MSVGIGDLAVSLPELSVAPSVAGIDGSGGATTIPPVAVDQSQQGPVSDQQALINTATRLGVNPRDLATVMSFESGFSPSIRGGAGNRHIGLIQFGPTEQKQYGASQSQSFQDQLPAVERYLTDRGFKPGMSMLDLYSTINAGSPGLYNKSDARNGGTWGSVADKVNSQFGPHYAKADKFLAGTSFVGGGTTPGSANPGMSVGSTAMQGGFGLNGIQAQGGPIAGQSAPAGVPSLADQPMTAMGPTAQSMMPGRQAAAPQQAPSTYGNLMNQLQGAAGALGKAGQQQGQQKSGGGGMQLGQPYRPNAIGLQQAKALFDPSRFYQALQAAGIQTGGQR